MVKCDSSTFSRYTIVSTAQIVTHLLIHRDQVAIDPLEGSDLTVTLNQNCTSAAKTAHLKWISDVSLHMTSANNCDIK